MDDSDLKENGKGASLKAKYSVSLKKLKRIPGTFTRENPSYFFVDLLWLGTAFICSLIFGAVELAKRRRTLNFAISADADNVDFSNIDPQRFAEYVSEHVDKIREAIDLKNKNIHMLASIIDPLPSFLARPANSLAMLTTIAMVYFVLRFWFLHQNWRYHGLLLFMGYLAYFPTEWWSSADTQLAIHITFHWAFPTAAAISVIFHKLLGDNAWKPVTILLQLRPRKDRPTEEEGEDEDTKALLKDDEVGQKGDN